MYESDRNLMDSISGYQRKTVDCMDIRLAVCGNEFNTRPTGSDVPTLTWVTIIYIRCHKILVIEPKFRLNI